jgi:multidrug efflux pump subunit AcrA (membrane-fusion protein)
MSSPGGRPGVRDVKIFSALRRRRTLLVLALVAGAGAVGIYAARRSTPPAVPMAIVTRGEFVDVVELRGEVRPVKSVVLSAPMQAGDLQIIRLTKNNTAVKPGDLVIEFDSTSLRRTLEDRKTELKQAGAEIEQAEVQVRNAVEGNMTRLLRARSDVNRATLDIVDGDWIARLDRERAVLALDDAKQRLNEAEKRRESEQAGAATTLAQRERRRDRVRQDLARVEQVLAALEIRAPSAGTVSIMSNTRTGNASVSQEFREGDRVWGGAGIVELPDLSSVHVAARLEEADRGRVSVGQSGTVRLDAIPDRDYRADVTAISLLARVDFSGAWPPARDFDMQLVIRDADTKLKPGMTATVRIAVGRLADVLIVPVEAVLLLRGRPTVYRLAGSSFRETPVTVMRRGREQVALASGVQAGDRVALKKPASAATRDGR